jgi:SnoaL-like domain
VWSQEEREEIMSRFSTLIALGFAIGIALWMHGLSLPALAKTKISQGAEVKADDKTVREIVAAFHRAEDFLQARNLESLMALYSKDYNYHGLKKEDLKKIWHDLFANYHRLSSAHMFSRIVVAAGKTPTAEVTCTGVLWATSDTGQRVNIDSWFEEEHHLTYEDGAWRIRGHAGEAPKGLQFGVAPHPFF